MSIEYRIDRRCASCRSTWPPKGSDKCPYCGTPARRTVSFVVPECYGVNPDADDPLCQGCLVMRLCIRDFAGVKSNA